MTGWFRTYRHPQGAFLDGPDYHVRDDGVYPVIGPRDGPDPWFVVENGLVYPTRDHPAGHADEPWFEIVGSMLYPVKGNPGAGHPGPWFQQVQTPDPA